MSGRRVCVTGASGFIASWLVKLLLERGYQVRGTVRSLANPAKSSHLKSLAGAEERLELVEADLLAKDSVEAAVRDCRGVFHTASPFFYKTDDPERELIEPAVRGTVNVLEACHKHGVEKVVVTSSVASIAYDPKRDRSATVDESCFSDADYCRSIKAWYVLSKTLAEEAAWQMAKEKGINMLTIHPAMVIGPLLQPTLNTSCEAILHLVDGSKDSYPNVAFGWVGVKDVAQAHILAYEDSSAAGRYVCVDKAYHFSEISRLLRNLYPELPIPTKCEDEVSPKVQPYNISSLKIQKLGLKFQPLEELLKECVDSLKSKQFIK